MRLLRTGFRAALLFGAGAAHAVVNLDPRATGEDVGVAADDYVFFAAEKLYAMSATATGADKDQPVTAMATANAYRLWARVPIGFEDWKTYYLRYDLLAGGVNNAGLLKFDVAEATVDPSSASLELADFERLQWEDGESAAIFSFRCIPGDVVEINGLAPPAIAAGANPVIEWKLDDGDEILARVESPVAMATYQARMSIWEERSDAIRADFDRETDGAPLWHATAPLMRVVPTVSATAAQLPSATARVRSDFRKFKAADDSALPTANLATVTVGVKTSWPVSATVTAAIRDPQDGTAITASDVLGKVDATVAGSAGTASFAFGEFYLGSSCAAAASAMTRVPKPDPATDKSSAASLTRALDATGAHTFCANAAANDPAKATNPYGRMPNVEYRLDLDITLAGGTADKPIKVARDCGAAQPCNTKGAAFGRIKREGTSVRIGFLTTASNFGLGRQVWQGWEGGAYNQRLVLANHGIAAAEYELGEFAAENGVRVEAKEVATGVIEGGTAITVPVRDLVTITGGARASGVLTVNAPSEHVSVATTQVTLPEGQTDTVRYHPR